MTLYQRFLRKPEFGSYEDFLHNFRINVPENFNFAYDVLDVIAEEEPEKRALQWAHMDGRERAFTFAEIARLSKQAANLFVRLGIQKGDKVMLVLRRHYTFWIAIMALCRIGAVAVPATHLLTKKDIVYRANCAGIKMVVTSAEGCFAASCEEALSECPTVEKLLIVDGEREGWLDFEALLAEESDEFPRPAEPLKHDDIMLLYFTSGTSGMPKMVGHNFDYPLGHIQTAVFWHQCVDGGLHLTVSETGWMKSVWGKLYGQWLAGSAIMVYDFEKFVPKDMLAVLEKY
ncbi:MAG TPA: AMP-binding protein, partial [Candidatus Pullichristensenella stercoripullorum]|nr:AMP-binding protein [Candidatus Pullichristensenella stercoripullorum]